MRVAYHGNTQTRIRHHTAYKTCAQSPRAFICDNKIISNGETKREPRRPESARAYNHAAPATYPTHRRPKRNHPDDRGTIQTWPSTKPNTAKRQAANHPDETPTTQLAAPQPADDAAPLRTSNRITLYG
jgi:hypothetical protein